MPTDVTLASVLQHAQQAAIAGLHVAGPARVLSYDDATHTCSVQPLIKRAYQNEAGERVAETQPVIQGVPVAFLGGGGARIKFPVLPGHTVLLVYCSSSIDRYKIQGGLVDPQDDRRHHLSDAIAIPTVLDRAHAGNDDPVIEFTSTEIRAGGTNPLVTKAEFDAHTHGETGSTTTTPTNSPITGTAQLRG